MSSYDIQFLVDQLKAGEITRRSFMKRASALGISAAAAGMFATNVAAQDATPGASPAASPVASPVGSATTSVTRDEYLAQLRQSFEIEEPAQSGGQVIFISTSDIRTLNPQLVTDVYSGYITDFVYDYLAVGSAIDGTPVPSLADYWELAEDGVTYTFHLNENATWHDGEPVTADDVIFSFDSILDEQSLSVRRSTVMIVLSEYRKIDDRTVQLVGFEPQATFLQDTAFLVGIVPMHLWQDVPPAEWGSDTGSTGTDPARVVGSGPFRFVEWVQGDHVTMARNDDYWDQERIPAIDEFIIQVVADASSAVASLQTGGSDIAELTPTDVAPLQESNPELIFAEFDTTGFNYFYVNQDPAHGDIFTDVRVRQAFMYALDRDIIADTVYLGYAVRAVGTQPVLSVAYKPDAVETDYVFDPEMARTLLEEAGWTDTDGDSIVDRDGIKLSFEIYYSEGSATYEQQIPYMQQAWREVGIEMIPAAIPFPTLIDNAIAGNFDMTIAGFSWGVDGSQGDMFRCNATPPDGFNRMRFCNEEYDELDVQQRRELDPEARIDILIQQSNIVNNEAAAGILVFSKDVFANAPRIHNFLPNGYSTLWSLPYMWVEQE